VTSEAGGARATVVTAGQGPAAVLIGPPGAGKSTVGRLLAEHLGMAFCDTDDRVEAVAGKPVADIFIEDGEPAFRALEREAVAWAVAGRGRAPGCAVIGLGGGAVMDPGTQRTLAGLPVVYLATGFATAAKRIGMNSPRPLLAGNPRAMLRALLEQRLPVYEKLAWITVSTDDRDPGDIAADIAAQIRQARSPGARQAGTAGTGTRGNAAADAGQQDTGSGR
jgi:shikimate kinase